MDEPVFELSIPGYGEPIKFNTWFDVEEFFSAERDAWLPFLNSQNTRDNLQMPLNKVWDHYITKLTELSTTASNIASDGSSQAQAKKILTQISPSYANGTLIYSKSPLGKHILELSSTNPKVALAVMALNGNYFEYSMHQASWWYINHGAMELIKFKLGGCGFIEKAEESLSDLSLDLGARFKKEEEKLDFRIKNLDSKISETKKKQDRVNTFFTSLTKRIRNFHSDWISEKKAITDSFIEQMRLEAPAEYWRKKATSHTKSMIGSLLIFIAIAISGYFVVKSNYDEITATPIKTSSLSGSAKSIEPNRYTELVVIVALPAILLLWFLRFLARIFITNMHKREEALEKHTYVKMYLSLIREGDGVASTDERILVLNALFRGEGGEKHDDSMPPNLLEILKQQRN